MSRANVTVEKIMSLDFGEFHRGLRALAPDLRLGDGQKEVEILTGNFTVRISCEPLADETLGGLLKMPRARVTLTSDEADEDGWADFVARFDKAFQRGGG